MRGWLACQLGMGIVGGATGAAAPPRTAASAARAAPYAGLSPERLPYEKGEPVPAGYVVETNSTRLWAILTGSIVEGVFYTYGLLSVRGGSKGAEGLLLP